MSTPSDPDNPDEEEEPPNCCIEITVPTATVSSGPNVSVVTSVTPVTDTKEIAVLSGATTKDVSFDIPVYTLTTETQDFDFTVNLNDIEAIDDISFDTESFVQEVYLNKETDIVTIPTIGTTTVNLGIVAGTTNQQVTITTKEYVIGGTTTQTIPFSASVDLNLVTDIQSTTTSVLTGVETDCSSTEISYLKDTGETESRDVTVKIKTYTADTKPQKVDGTIDEIVIPGCEIPILKTDGSIEVPSYISSDITETVYTAAYQSDETLYSYELDGFEPITINDVTVTIPECTFDLAYQADYVYEKLYYETYTLSTSTQKVELDINIPSCDAYSYSITSSTTYIENYLLSSTPKSIICSFNDYDLTTTKSTASFSASLNVPIYETRNIAQQTQYLLPQFKKTIIPDCSIPVISESCEIADITGAIKLECGTLDETFKIPKISCSSLFIPSYDTSYHYFDCATYSGSLSVSYKSIEISQILYSASLSSSSSNISQSFCVPTYSQSSSEYSVRSYQVPYYSSSSRKSRTLVKCKPGGFNKQPPTPTWTNTGRSKLLIEVVYREGVADRLEREGRMAKDGHGVIDHEKDLVIYMRDYKTGNILEELDNSIDLWGWVTAKDAENSHNDKFDPFGNKIQDDPRYGQKPVELIKANMVIERHHSVEDLRFIDTPLNRGHLQSNQVKEALPYEKVYG